MDPKTATNCRKDRFRKYIGSARPGGYPLAAGSPPRPKTPAARPPAPPRSCDPPHPDQVAEDYALQRLRRGDSGVAPVAAQRHGLNRGTVFVKGAGVAFPRGFVKIQFDAGAGFGIAQLQFSNPGRGTVLIRPDLKQHELVAEIGQILQRSLAAVVVQKIRNHDDQPALRIRTDEDRK